ncbi:MAG: hypothetical protein ACMG6H_07405 [Acidobacteriota bacterium]
MVKASLVESDIEEGRKLLDELKKIDSHFLIRSAFWLYRPETFDWRLFIATPLVDQRGPATAYTDVQGALRSLPSRPWISMQDISVVSPNDKLVKLMNKAAHIPRGAPGIRLARSRVDDTFIEDAYIYRLKPRSANEVFGNR